MKYLIYAAACWSVVSVIAAVLLCRRFHKAKVREVEGINGRFEP